MPAQNARGEILELETGETIILTDGRLGNRETLTLTNKRLIIQKNKGIFKTKLVIKKEIPLDTIDEATTWFDYWVRVCVRLRLKNGKSIILPMYMSDREMLKADLENDFGGEGVRGFLFETTLDRRTKPLANRWAEAINNQLTGHQEE